MVLLLLLHLNIRVSCGAKVGDPPHAEDLVDLDPESSLLLGLGKKTREPRTEPKLPRTDTEGTGTEEVRFLFGSMI